MRTYEEMLAYMKEWKRKKRRLLGIPEKGKKPFCKHGHPRTPENIRKGRRDCSVCNKEQRIRRARLRGVKPFIGIKRNGQSRTRIYKIWSHMIDRCHNANHDRFRFYGARGVTVCDRWRNSFDNFVSDMGQPPKGLSLDRINTLGIYEPSNCRWATKAEQMRNMRNNIWIEYQGKMYTHAELARFLGIDTAKLWKRLFEYHWPLEKAVRKHGLFA